MRGVPLLTWAAIFTCAALLACGGNSASTGRLAIALEQGTEVRARAGARTEIVLLVVGAKDRPVSLALDSAPPFVTLVATTLVVAPDRSAEAGPHHITVTATAGADSDTKTFRLIVDRTNSAVELRTVNLVDARGHTLWAKYGPWPGCLSGLRAEGSLFEPGDEQDPARVEVEVVRASTPFTGVATFASDWLSTRRVLPAYGGSFIDYSVEIPGIEMGEAYRVAVRGVDALGDATEWWPSGEVTCTPFAFPAFPRRTMTGSLCTSLGVLEFDIEGTLPGDAQVEAIGLPTWATLATSGSTVTIRMSPPAGLTPWTSLPFELRVTAGGYTASARYTLVVC